MSHGSEKPDLFISIHEARKVPTLYYYAYGVNDDYSGTNFEAAEDSDGSLVR